MPNPLKSLYEFVIPGYITTPSRAQIQISKDVPESSGITGSTPDLMKLVSQARTISGERAEIYKMLESMAKDSTISSVVEMMAEDASQFSTANGHVFWPKSKDKKIEKELEDFLFNVVKVDSRANHWSMQVLIFGDMFLRTFYSDRREASQLSKDLKSGVRKLEMLTEAQKDASEITTSDEFYEEVGDPSTISDLQRFGRTVAYLETLPDGKSRICPVQDFVHFCSDRSVHRRDVVLPITVEDPKSGAKSTVDRVFRVKFGTSFLEGAMQAFNIVQLLEDILVVSRISKSSLFRLFAVNVGTSSDAQMVRMLREFKNALTKKENIDIRTGNYRAAAKNIPIGENVVVPIRNGKGDVQYTSIGGDVDVKSMTDFDYFFGKLLTALHVPQAYLSPEPIGGQYSNTSLTRLDVRYSRIIRRLVSVLQAGIIDLCNHHLRYIGKEDWVGKFEIEFAPVSDAGEAERIQDEDSKANLVSNLLNVLSSELIAGDSNSGGDGYIDREHIAKIVDYLIYEVLNLPEPKRGEKLRNPIPEKPTPPDDSGYPDFSGGTDDGGDPGTAPVSADQIPSAPEESVTSGSINS